MKMKKPRYEYRIATIMFILTVIPIGATQLGWYLYDKQVSLDRNDCWNIFGYTCCIFDVSKGLA